MYRLFSSQQKRRFRLLFILIVMMGLFDLAGVALLLPFLAVVADPGVIETQPVLSFLHGVLGFSSDFAFLIFLGAGTFCVVMVGLAVRLWAVYRMNLFSRDVATTLGTARLRHFLMQPYDWFLGQHSADLSKSVLQEINEVVIGTLNPGLRLISNTAVMVFLSGFVLWIDPVGALVIFALLGLGYGAVYGLLSQSLADRGRDRMRANRERYQAMNEALSGIKEVKMLGLEESYLGKYHGPSRRLAGHQAALTLVGEVPRFAIEALTFGGMLLYTVWLLYSRDGGLPQILPVLGAFAFAGLRLLPTVQSLFRDFTQVRFGQAVLHRLADDLRDGVRGPLLRLPSRTGPGGDKLGLRSRITLDGVRYRYPDAKAEALAGVDMTIEAGQTVGIAGASGAGKTTITDLLLGLITPYQGRIAADGAPITDANLQAWRRTVGFVPQTIHLVDDTLASNVARGIPPEDIDTAALDRALEQASLGELVTSLPEGVRTRIGEGGARLSGGQRQRLGIARALYRDPDVLVFDEATSALDTVTERSVMDAIRKLQGQKTVIMVSHRLSTLAGCDTIFLMREGRILISGSYATLTAQSPDFRQMLAAAE